MSFVRIRRARDTETERERERGKEERKGNGQKAARGSTNYLHDSGQDALRILCLMESSL